MADKYPRLAALGVAVQPEPVSHVKHKDLKAALGASWDRFCDLFGVQTAYVDGPYPWDVEAVLERMATGRLTGTQLDPD